VAVFSSQEVEIKMQDMNGFTPAEFLRPYGDVGNLNNTSLFRHDGTSFKLKNFRVNFIDSKRMKQTNQEENGKLVSKIVKTNTPKNFLKSDSSQDSLTKGRKDFKKIE